MFLWAVFEWNECIGSYLGWGKQQLQRCARRPWDTRAIVRRDIIARRAAASRTQVWPWSGRGRPGTQGPSGIVSQRAANWLRNRGATQSRQGGAIRPRSPSGRHFCVTVLVLLARRHTELSVRTVELHEKERGVSWRPVALRKLRWEET